MDEKRSTTQRLNRIEGVDAAALGLAPPPVSAPPGAEVDDAEHEVPGAHFGDRIADESKPWFTSLAAESDQAGVGNEPPDAQEPEFPVTNEERGRPSQ